MTVGIMAPYAGDAASVPAGWLLCDGAAVSRTIYASLFALIGTTYGPGDGATTFNLPDVRDRSLYGVGAVGPGNALGGTFGSKNHAHGGVTGAHNHGGVSGSHSHGGATGSHDHGGATGPTTATANNLGVGVAPLVTNTHTHPIPSGTAPISADTVTIPSGTAPINSDNPPGLSVNFIIKV